MTDHDHPYGCLHFMRGLFPIREKTSLLILTNKDKILCSEFMKKSISIYFFTFSSAILKKDLVDM